MGWNCVEQVYQPTLDRALAREERHLVGVELPRKCLVRIWGPLLSKVLGRFSSLTL